MLLSLTILAAALPAVVLGGEFPVINGVVGGTPPDATFSERDSDPTDVGIVGLRYVENSGVCGKIPLSQSHFHPICSPKNRDHPRRVLGFRLCGHYSHRAHVVLVLCGPQQPRRCAADNLVERRGKSFLLLNHIMKALISRSLEVLPCSVCSRSMVLV